MPAGKMILEMIRERIILDRTLPAGAVPARLLRSGEYSIRGTFDLISKSSLLVRGRFWSTARGYRVMAASCRHACPGDGS